MLEVSLGHHHLSSSILSIAVTMIIYRHRHQVVISMIDDGGGALRTNTQRAKGNVLKSTSGDKALLGRYMLFTGLFLVGEKR